MSLSIIRSAYIEKIKPFIGKNLIKVLVGQRRTGKSYILNQIIDYIKKDTPDADIICINKELYAFDKIRNYHKLIKYVNKHKSKNKLTYLFIDKIIQIKEFEKALLYFLSEGGYDIYCTASNSNILSRELSSLLSGSYIKIAVHTLSYSEFLNFYNLENTEKSFERYFKFGGLPYLVNLREDETVTNEYLNNLYDAILYRDIVFHQKVINPFVLECLVRYIAEKTGESLSAKGISDFFKMQKIAVTPNILLSYIKQLTQAYIIARVKRSDITGNRIYENGDKFYFEDMGLRQSILGNRQYDTEKILENLVFNYFDRKGYRITTFSENHKKISFICQRKSEKLYVQVAYYISDEKIHQQIFGNLLDIHDNYPKYVFSLDPFTHNSYEGIIHMHIRDFLVSEI